MWIRLLALSSLSRGTRRNLAVVAGFLVFMAISLLVAYGAGQLPSPQQACAKQCSAIGRQGSLVYTGPAGKEFYKELHSECKCQ
jgi:hypothetical protein